MLNALVVSGRALSERGGSKTLSVPERQMQNCETPSTNEQQRPITMDAVCNQSTVQGELVNSREPPGKTGEHAFRQERPLGCYAVFDENTGP